MSEALQGSEKNMDAARFAKSEPGEIVLPTPTDLDASIRRLELELQTLKAARDIMERLGA